MKRGFLKDIIDILNQSQFFLSLLSLIHVILENIYKVMDLIMDWVFKSLFYPSILIRLINFSKPQTTETVNAPHFFWPSGACFLIIYNWSVPSIPTEKKYSALMNKTQTKQGTRLKATGCEKVITKTSEHLIKSILNLLWKIIYSLTYKAKKVKVLPPFSLDSFSL